MATTTEDLPSSEMVTEEELRLTLKQYIDIATGGRDPASGYMRTDVVFVLDCCYAHLAARDVARSTRKVEIIAASDDNTPFALGPPASSVSRKLRCEIERRKRDCHECMILADAMATIRNESTVVKPSHQVKLGVSVRLNFPGRAEVNPSNLLPRVHTLVSIHIAGLVDDKEVQDLVSWLESMPGMYRISVDAVYPAHSRILILRMGYVVYANLARLPGVKFIADLID
ncbi:hypothetical protein POX_e06921 [Penicillium oxalicum]|uniref:hypothetical protein n=1 Tax=Penicillium oxalicum TaxID=69781 RepID=UPI0020B82AE5|nr:hypothetical protein POX_e06921 [Penicillium oxalicum]KAI2788897.1 hypothetical protein POX_e06921 [Penicillium oxalicum]